MHPGDMPSAIAWASFCVKCHLSSWLCFMFSCCTGIVGVGCEPQLSPGNSALHTGWSPGLVWSVWLCHVEHSSGELWWSFVCLFVVWLCRMAWGISVPWPGMKPVPTVVEACPNHWTTSEVPWWRFQFWGCWSSKRIPHPEEVESFWGTTWKRH